MSRLLPEVSDLSAFLSVEGSHYPVNTKPNRYVLVLSQMYERDVICEFQLAGVI
jgi:hypothetical protein